MIRLILVEDEMLVRLGLQELLSLDGQVELVAVCPDGQSALDAIRQKSADIVLMDIRLPLLTGVEVLETLRSQGNTVPVILITTFDDDEMFFRAVRAGANGFIRKDSSLADLKKCFGRVLKGERVYRPAITEAGRAGLQAFRPSFDASDLPENLTKKEMEVLACMTAGMSNREIAESLGITEATVKTHVSTIFAKLGVRDRIRAVLRGLELGLV